MFVAPIIIAIATTTPLLHSHLYVPSPIVEMASTTATTTIPLVPFYSQFTDIASASWKKVGCGVASLAMIIDFYTPNAVSVNALLSQGISLGAYDYSAGWTYNGLISLSEKYGLSGESYDLKKLTSADALSQFKTYVQNGPVIASVHYKFDPKSKIPHLVVINRIVDDTIYYNDPAAKTGDKQISTADFLKGWKKRFIVMRPVAGKVASVSSVKKNI
jgi:predicted double-glycine peptidase